MKNQQKNKSCKERIAAKYKETVEILGRLYKNYCKDPEKNDPDYGTLFDYGLGFDYIEPRTFKDQRVGYYQYLLSWGGPSDEFRFYVRDSGIYRIEYWFLDWFDGAKRIVRSKKDFRLLSAIFYIMGGI